MKITYLGHSGFAIESGETLLIIDPWLGRNDLENDGKCQANEDTIRAVRLADAD